MFIFSIALVYFCFSGGFYSNFNVMLLLTDGLVGLGRGAFPKSSINYFLSCG